MSYTTAPKPKLEPEEKLKLQEQAASKADQARSCQKEYPKPDKLQVWVASKVNLGWAYVQGVDPATAPGAGCRLGVSHTEASQPSGCSIFVKP